MEKQNFQSCASKPASSNNANKQKMKINEANKRKDSGRNETYSNMNYAITLQRYDGLLVDLVKPDFALFVMVFQTQVTH